MVNSKVNYMQAIDRINFFTRFCSEFAVDYENLIFAFFYEKNVNNFFSHNFEKIYFFVHYFSF